MNNVMIKIISENSSVMFITQYESCVYFVQNKYLRNYDCNIKHYVDVIIEHVTKIYFTRPRKHFTECCFSISKTSAQNVCSIYSEKFNCDVDNAYHILFSY